MLDVYFSSQIMVETSKCFICDINVDEFLSLYVSSVFVVVCLPVVWLQVLCSFKISSYFFFANYLLLDKLEQHYVAYYSFLNGFKKLL